VPFLRLQIDQTLSCSFEKELRWVVFDRLEVRKPKRKHRSHKKRGKQSWRESAESARSRQMLFEIPAATREHTQRALPLRRHVKKHERHLDGM
jgi:hypothetical protein